MRLMLNGVEIELAPGLAVDVDMHGNAHVYIDGDYEGGQDEDLPVYGPGLTLGDLLGLLTAPNPLLQELAYVGVDTASSPGEDAPDSARQTECDCPTCRSDQEMTAANPLTRRVAEIGIAHATAQHSAGVDGELVAAPWHMTFRTNLIDVVVRYMERYIGEEQAIVLRNQLAEGGGVKVAVVVTPADMGMGETREVR